MNDSGLTDSIFGDGDGRSPQARPEGSPPERVALPGGGPRPTRSSRRRTEPSRPPTSEAVKRRRGCAVMLVALVVVLAGIGLALRHLGDGLLPSFGTQKAAGGDYSGSGSGSIEVIVNSGDSGYAIGRTLEKAGVIKSADTFAAVAASNPDFAKIQPGTYKMRQQMSASSALSLMLEPGTKLAGGVTIPEGLWKNEIFAILAKKTGTPLADYKKVQPATLGLPSAAGGNMEGYLFPSTYDFPKGMSAQNQLKTMVAEGAKQRKALGIPDGDVKKVLTIASIVQAESGASTDEPRIAQVVVNRMKPNPETNGFLQMDSTIHYAEQKRGTLQVTTQETKFPSIYNTYLHPGLPPGPINNPGVSAMKAALKPTPGPWLYFVTVNPQTGETLFATNLADQQKNTAKYTAWCQSHPGKC
ncbi:endolytic transglycosylase MltG [Calidifontibacter sp. DB0510]|uniref:Endolytic murein transglycosylase n=1 Tax=Metallococcus carri TaxID=1656884 RepID=A0A967AZ22_9MICO|nr:endolytic transglycosylase MltG [Metallococcus carri]NHN55029.1 endolytic transglycosylase MltG [Metallococcus carri]NOP37375.1 endolytic transglycosylase MltG [Calidifontibacter sp. DB2511S]